MASFSSILNKALNIKEGEQLAVYLLLLQTIFLGVFLAIFDITASSLFMSTFEESLISQAFLISGLVGIVLTAVYLKLQSIIPFSKLIFINLIIVSIITLMLRIGFEFTTSKSLIFIVFVMMGPLNLLGVVGFWGMASRLFTLRQGKRLFSLIDAGQIIGMIIISLSVPLLLRLLSDTKNLLYISAASIFCALLVQIIINSRFNLNHDDQKDKNIAKEDQISMIKIFRTNKYVRTMAMFVIFSMLSAFFMYFSFLPISKAKYPAPEEYTEFLGFFTAALMFFTLLIKTLAYNKLTKTYGLKVNLILPGAILAIFTLLAIVIGTIFGFTIESSSFMLFLMFISLGRMFSVSLKSSIEVPSQKILYQSLDINIRHRVQVAIDGVVNEIAAIISGLVLLILSLFEFFKIIHYSYFLIGVIVIWVIIALRLYKEYRQSLEVALDKSKADELTEKEADNNIITKSIKSNLERHKKVFPEILISFAEYLTPSELTIFYADKLYNQDQFFSNHIISKIKKEHYFELSAPLKNYISKASDTELKKNAKLVLDYLNTYDSKNKSIDSLVNSPYPENRIIASNIIRNHKSKEHSKYLILLLRDIFPDVRIAAIKAAGVIKDKEFLAVIVDYLSYERYHTHAKKTILNYGESALNYIEQLFYKSGLDEIYQIQIIRLISEIGGKSAIKLLLNKLNYQNRDIVIETCLSLKKCDYYTVEEKERAVFLNLLEEHISITAWNLNILVNIKENEIGQELKEAINAEISKNYSDLFLILSITYNPQSISHVQENLETESAEGISFAIELLDLFLDDNVKHKIFALLEDISDSERVRRLSDHFPLEKMDSIPLLNSIINRDSNYIHRWTKAVAIISLERINDFEVNNDIIAQLFNNDSLLSELSATLIVKKDRACFDKCASRLDPQKRNELQKFFLGKSKNQIYHKVNFLKSLEPFSNIDYNILTEIIEESKEIKISMNDSLNIRDLLSDGDIGIIEKGKLSINFNQRELNTGDIITDYYDNNKYLANENTLILRIPFEAVCKYINHYPALSNLLNLYVKLI